MTNPDDVDDCLQAGYLKVWKRLSANPDFFTDKPKRYAVQAVVMACKAQRYAHLRHYRKMIYDAEPTKYGERANLEPPQIDTWLDIAAALAHVSNQIEDSPPLLIALYTVITQSRVSETAHLYGLSAKTMYKHRRQIKSELTEALPGYCSPDSSETMIGLPDQPVVKPLLNTIYQDENKRKRQSDQRDFNLLAQAKRRQHIRKQIRPYYSHYPTGWAGNQSLEQLMIDPQVRRGAYAKLDQLGVEHDDQEDIYQQGIIRQWQKLRDAPDLLADKGPVWAGIYIAYRGNPKAFLRHQYRQYRFTNPAFDWDMADEHRTLARQNGHHAAWTHQVHEEIDLAIKMNQLAQKYEGDLRHLLALYALTTSAYIKDVAPIMGLHPKNFAAAVGNDVKKDLIRVFDQEDTN